MTRLTGGPSFTGDPTYISSMIHINMCIRIQPRQSNPHVGKYEIDKRTQTNVTCFRISWEVTLVPALVILSPVCLSSNREVLFTTLITSLYKSSRVAKYIVLLAEPHFVINTDRPYRFRRPWYVCYVDFVKCLFCKINISD